ncbi:MAG: response regulator [Pelagibacterales bacterium]|nr:response regulator [Pelagibacterales bacterium]
MAQQKSSPVKIAIIEDDSCNRFYLEMVIKKMDCQPIIIDNPKQSIEILHKEKPHIVLLDIKLSDEISGIDIAKLMKSDEFLKSVPIIVVSAFAVANEVKEISHKTKCDSYITKPFSVDNLIDVITEQLFFRYGD